MRQWRKFLLPLLLLLLFFLLQYELWFSHGGIIQNHRLQEQLKQEKALLKKQQEKNKALVAEVVKIKQNPETIEAYARDELGMVKQGEEYIEVADKPGANN